MLPAGPSLLEKYTTLISLWSYASLARVRRISNSAVLTSAGAIYKWYSKRQRYETAISLEFRRAIRMIDVKLSWLKRALPLSIVEATPNRMVRINGEYLYLGEDEKFTLPLPFWQTNFNEIVSILPTKSFSSFSKTAELIEMFESKFYDMKLSFIGTVGNPSEMAAACFNDLLAIRQRMNIDCADITKFS